jgi:hypothetical protein
MYRGNEEWDQLRYSAKIFSVEERIKEMARLDISTYSRH